MKTGLSGVGVLQSDEFKAAWAACAEPLKELIRKRNIAVEELTENQLAEVIVQAAACGDIMRHVRVDNGAQAVTWVPYRREQELLSRISELEARIDSQNVLPSVLPITGPVASA